MGRENKAKINKHIKTRPVKIGNLYIGGGYPVAVQGMVKVKTSQINLVLREIKELEKEKAEIIRIAVKDKEDVSAIRKIKQNTSLPLVADIHFNYELAKEAINAGVDKIRLNPGNIYNQKEIEEIILLLKEKNIPLRIGVNSGSLRKEYKRFSLSEGLVRQAMDYLKIVEKYKFYDIVISLKASSVVETILAYKKISKLCNYPLHLGVTATGPGLLGIVKSSISLGYLLYEGIGDTIRVSLTDSSVQEVRVAKNILEALGLRSFGPEIISCPTCGRCRVDLINMVEELRKELVSLDSTVVNKPEKIAIMGCEVNGPGEAKEADIGIAFGKDFGFLFKKGKAIRRIKTTNYIKELLKDLKGV